MEHQSSRLGSENGSNEVEPQSKELNGNNLNKMNSQEKLNRRTSKKTMRRRTTNMISSGNMSEFSPSHWSMNHSPRQHLYPAMSDPSVCSYQIPISFPMESVSFPFYSVYQPPVLPEVRKQSSHFPSSRVPAQSRVMNNMYFRQSENYTSLPPVSTPEATEDHQRRFSDPGLGNVEDSEEDSASSCSDYSLSPNSSKLMDQVASLNNEVQRLSTQLSQTQSELVDLKLDMVSIKNSVTLKNEQPGFLSEMIGEIKKAAELREKAFLSKVSSIISTLSSKDFGVSKSQECGNPEKLDYPQSPSAYSEVDSMKKVAEVQKKCKQLEMALSDAVSARMKAESEAETWKNKLESLQKETLPTETVKVEKDCDNTVGYVSSVNHDDSKELNLSVSPSKKSDVSFSSHSDTNRKNSDSCKTVNLDPSETASPTKILISKSYSRKSSSGLEMLDHLDDHALGPVTDL